MTGKQVSRFVDRTRELRQLAELMARVRTTGDGVILTIRGRRQMGKSTLVEEFLRNEDVPHVFFAASFGADPAGQRASFTAEVAASILPSAVAMKDVAFSAWEGLLAALAEGIRGPSVVVVDELPWLLRADPSFEGALQTAWDWRLSRRPVLLVLLGSDLGMMSVLGTYERPLYGRAREMVLDPLSPPRPGRAARREPGPGP